MNGSPRERTHSSMIEALEKGLTDAGSEVTKRSVYKLDIRPCISCGTCMRKTPGICAQKDDMETLLTLVAHSDLLMLVTPIYLDGMTGPMKTFIDRLIPLLEWKVEVRDGRVGHPIRKGVKQGKIGLMSASTFPEPETFDPLVAHVKAISRNLKREYAGEILVPGRGHLIRRGGWDSVLEIIESVGAHLVKEGRIPENISSKFFPQITPEEFVRELNDYIAKLK
ncbi:MAG: flavodoxin family protein [Methanomassiliicoccales archaeon]|nr:flavodoxin family protein [Methanomassiliicoccales archaeon]